MREEIKAVRVYVRKNHWLGARLKEERVTCREKRERNVFEVGYGENVSLRGKYIKIFTRAALSKYR